MDHHCGGNATMRLPARAMAPARTFSLRRRAAAMEQAIRELLSGNICRCTGYQGIVDALMDYAP